MTDKKVTLSDLDHLKNSKQFLVYVMPVLYEIVVNIITLTPITILCWRLWKNLKENN